MRCAVGVSSPQKNIGRAESNDVHLLTAYQSSKQLAFRIKLSG